MTNFDRVFEPGRQYVVDTPEGRVALVFANASDSIPNQVVEQCFGMRAILRFAGGVAGLSPPERRRLYEHIEAAFKPVPLVPTVLMSGGTRLIDTDERVAMTVLELPWLIRKWHSKCRTMGSAPRTKPTSSLVGDSRFVPSDSAQSRTAVHPGSDLFWYVQATASQQRHSYTLDIPLYMDLMDLLRAGGMATGLWVFGGGDVTLQEITEAVERGHPCAVVRGSGGVADQIADVSRIDILDSPADTQAWLGRNGFVRQAS